MNHLTGILQSLKPQQDEDLVDRLNYYCTSGLLIGFALIVSAKQYVGYPIQCWLPAHFTEAMEQYTENYCWVQNTWFLNLHEFVPKEPQERKERQIVYYQWTPFLLIFEAFWFFLPCLAWRLLNWQTGLEPDTIIQQLNLAKTQTDYASRARVVESVAVSIHSFLRQKAIALKHYTQSTTTTPSDYYVSSLYCLVKLAYCGNLIFQLWFLKNVLDLGSYMFGIDMMVSLLRGNVWEVSGIFPRVTLCDLEVKVMGNVHRHTVQCVLMINMFNEKIFLFLWFWFTALFLATFLNFFYWTCILFWRRAKVRFIKSNLWIQRGESYNLCQTFMHDYLSTDILLTLRFCAKHCGQIVFRELLTALWSKYLDGYFGSNANYNENPLSETQETFGTTLDDGLTNPGGFLTGFAAKMAKSKPEKAISLEEKFISGNRTAKRQDFRPITAKREERFMRQLSKRGLIE